jgi:hypothetical protein
VPRRLLRVEGEEGREADDGRVEETLVKRLGEKRDAKVEEQAIEQGEAVGVILAIRGVVEDPPRIDLSPRAELLAGRPEGAANTEYA